MSVKSPKKVVKKLTESENLAEVKRTGKPEPPTPLQQLTVAETPGPTPKVKGRPKKTLEPLATEVSKIPSSPKREEPKQTVERQEEPRLMAPKREEPVKPVSPKREELKREESVKPASPKREEHKREEPVKPVSPKREERLTHVQKVEEPPQRSATPKREEPIRPVTPKREEPAKPMTPKKETSGKLPVKPAAKKIPVKTILQEMAMPNMIPSRPIVKRTILSPGLVVKAPMQSTLPPIELPAVAKSPPNLKQPKSPPRSPGKVSFGKSESHPVPHRKSVSYLPDTGVTVSVSTLCIGDLKALYKRLSQYKTWEDCEREFISKPKAEDHVAIFSLAHPRYTIKPQDDGWQLRP